MCPPSACWGRWAGAALGAGSEGAASPAAQGAGPPWRAVRFRASRQASSPIRSRRLLPGSGCLVFLARSGCQWSGGTFGLLLRSAEKVSTPATRVGLSCFSSRGLAVSGRVARLDAIRRARRSAASPEEQGSSDSGAHGGRALFPVTRLRYGAGAVGRALEKADACCTCPLCLNPCPIARLRRSGPPERRGGSPLCPHRSLRRALGSGRRDGARNDRSGNGFRNRLLCRVDR